MATVTHRAQIADTTPNNTSASFTPTAGDLIVVAQSSGNVVAGSGSSVTASANGITFTEVTGATATRAGTEDCHLYVANQLVPGSPAAMTVTIVPTGTSTGVLAFVASVSGLTRSGLSAVRLGAGTNQGAAATPAVALGGTTLTGNPVLAFAWNATNPSGITIPGSFTAGAADAGYASPTRGGRYAFANSGITLSTITWGGASATASANIAVELDTSVVPTRPRFNPIVNRVAVFRASHY